MTLPTAHDDRDYVPTLSDVAERAGVSTATVSRCLNTPEQVVQSTRDRVMAAVRELGYAPNFGARALAAKRTNTFGAIIPTMENAVFARGLQAFQDELGRSGVTLLVASSSYKPDLEEEQIRALVARGADALLLIGLDRTEATYAFLERRRIPYVASWVFDRSGTRPTIGFDNEQAMKTLTDHVIELGHRSLALITAERAQNDRARERSNGVLRSMREHGLDPNSLQVIETPYSIANGARGFETLMEANHTPTAVLCGNDVLAAGALTMAKKLGIRVPEDVSVTGFDDIEVAEIVTPPLTTVHVPHREMGTAAARLLLAMRNGEGTRRNVELAAKVKWRNSLGRAPNV